MYDPRECTLPDVGIVNIKDSETGRTGWVNTSSSRMRGEYEQWFRDAQVSRERLLNRYNVDNVSIATCDDYVKGLLKLFRSAK